MTNKELDSASIEQLMTDVLTQDVSGRFNQMMATVEQERKRVMRRLVAIGICVFGVGFILGTLTGILVVSGV